jgi:uncharacterized heparinase superfamily protein
MGERIDARYRRRAEAAAPLQWQHPGLAAAAGLRAARRDPDLALAAARAALDGRFGFLGETRELGRPVAWDRPDLAQALLWKTHLHEFPFAIDLALAHRASGDPAFRAGFLALARDWVGAQPIAKPGFQRVAWNERVVATRLVNWSMAGALFGLREDSEEAAWLGREIARHALFLRDNLALDLLANHLFRDAVALAWAHDLARACPEGLRLLEREVEAQILPDGGHVERSPMYHALCLQDLVELHALLGARAPGWLGDAVRRAGGFLESVLLGDGDIPLLGDAWRGEVAPRILLEQACAAAGPLVAPREPERWSGLVRLERGAVRAVLRCGPHGPDYQLGHAHADLLSFDASLGSARVVTDTGTGAYAAGPVRERLRSTAAHNTLALDGAELLEAWSSFRSGRRGRARGRARGTCGRFEWIWASHDGWTWLPGAPVHHRLLAVAGDGVLVLDAVLGAGRHRMVNRLHLHPELPVDLARVVALGGATGERRAPLHERFGATREMRELAVEAEAELPWAGGWWIGLAGGEAPAASLAVAGGSLRADLTGSAAPLRVRWDLAAPPGAGSFALEPAC